MNGIQLKEILALDCVTSSSFQLRQSMDNILPLARTLFWLLAICNVPTSLSVSEDKEIE